MMKFARSLSILALAGLAFGGAAFAQVLPQAGQDNPAQLMQSFRQKNQELIEIQHKTLENNPKLSAEMDHYRAEMNKAMLAHGYDAVKGDERAKALVAKLQSGKKMTDAERESTIKSYQAEQKKMMKARAAAMQDPKIEKDRKTLSAHMIAAMKKQDSRTAQLIKDVEEMRAKIIEVMAAHRPAAKK